MLGIYQTVSVDPLNKRTVTHYVVMENLFYNQTISYKFDLKGSNRNRYATEGSRKQMGGWRSSGGEHAAGYELYGEEKRSAASSSRVSKDAA